MAEVKERVTQILVSKLGIKETEITDEANFIKDLGMDSLDYAEVVMEFEQAFDIQIPDHDAENLITVGKAIQYISSKTSA
ncbi:MAG: acyl carrier protein [Cytophagales bacterium]|nr:acyl carrier protein [Cytophagales bacterium]